MSIELIVEEVLKKAHIEMDKEIGKWKQAERERLKKIEDTPNLWLVVGIDGNEFNIEADSYSEKVSGESVVLKFFIGDKEVGIFKEWKHVQRVKKKGYRDY